MNDVVNMDGAPSTSNDVKVETTQTESAQMESTQSESAQTTGEETKSTWVSKEEYNELVNKIGVMSESINKILVEKAKRSGLVQNITGNNNQNEIESRLKELEKLNDEISMREYTQKTEEIFKSKLNRDDIINKLKVTPFKDREKVFTESVEKEKAVILELSKLMGVEKALYDNKFLNDDQSVKTRIQNKVNEFSATYTPSELDRQHGFVPE
ncbi:MAG: hypothetical protein ACRCST_13570, partial [Turicibacter sp.]